MLSPAQLAQFRQDGYLLVPSLFGAGALQEARQAYLQAFADGLYQTAPYSNPTIINNIFQYLPTTLPALITAPYIAAIKAILGNDAVWIPECSIHRNRYIGWHKDTSIQELGGETSHLQDTTPLLQTAIYFQDNTPGHGGGLTVIAGSHSDNSRYHGMFSHSLLHRSYYKLLKWLHCSPFHRMERSPHKVDIPCRAGDLIIFDVRLDHRATRPLHKDLPTDKLAMFQTFGKPNTLTKNYFKFMKQRPEPYYRYFREVPLPQAVYQHVAALGIEVWY